MSILDKIAPPDKKGKTKPVKAQKKGDCCPRCASPRVVRQPTGGKLMGICRNCHYRWVIGMATAPRKQQLLPPLDIRKTSRFQGTEDDDTVPRHRRLGNG